VVTVSTFFSLTVGVSVTVVFVTLLRLLDDDRAGVVFFFLLGDLLAERPLLLERLLERDVDFLPFFFVC